MKAEEFYRITFEMLDTLAAQHGVKDLNQYYVLTDFKSLPQLKQLSGIEQTFAQIAYHGQNATLISNIIKFEYNYDKIKEILSGFQPDIFLKQYQSPSREENIGKLIQKFKDSGFSWNTSKSKTNPNAIITRYSNLLLDAAKYLKDFNTKQEVIDDLQSNYKNNDIKKLITYFRSKVQSGYSIALTCDFLKEFDEKFNNLPKPDVHIKDTISILKGHEIGYYHTEKREYECIKEFQELVNEINKSIKSSITVYQLDRMIWLICSNKFFLDDKSLNSKEEYLSKLS